MEQSSPASGLNGDQSPGEFAEKMRRTFDSVNEIEASFVANEALRANDQDNVGFIESGEKSEKEKKDREALAAYQDMIDAEAESREAEIRRMQDDYSRTYSDDELDMMEWRGDKNAAWTMGGKQKSRAQWYDAMKSARAQWGNSAEAQAMSPEDRAKVDASLSRFMQATKNGDQERATEEFNRLPPSLQRYAIKADARQTGRTVDGEVANADTQATPTAAVGQHSVVAGSNILDDAASISPAVDAPATITAPLSVAVTRDEQLNNATPDLRTGFNAAANAQPSDATLQRTAEIRLAAARAPAPDQAIGI